MRGLMRVSSSIQLIMTSWRMFSWKCSKGLLLGKADSAGRLSDLFGGLWMAEWGIHSREDPSHQLLQYMALESLRDWCYMSCFDLVERCSVSRGQSD